MPEFSADLRDMRFNLFDFLKVQELAQSEHYADYDKDVIDDTVNAAYDQAKNLLYPITEDADKEGVKLVDGRVITPKGHKEAYATYCESGWIGLQHDVSYGGMGFPDTAAAAVSELFTAANLSLVFTPGLTSGALGLIAAFGTDEQKATYLEKMLSGQWSGTMALTEAGAGSAVPDLKSTAYPIEGEERAFKIKGQKIFITSGDHDMAECVVHLLLARVDGDPPGTKGVSLFIVPSKRPDANGNAGEDNDIAVVALEEKLGIHASATCQLAFGDEDNCIGWLVGRQGEGLKCMFQMMNEARISVGVQGVAMGALAYQWALEYAKERIQGVRLEDMRDVNAPRVAIVEHPDVRRMLMYMKAVAEGGRALVLYGAMCADRMHTAEDDKSRQRWAFQLEILTPIIKAWCSDEGFRATELGVQVMGGYGYVREYGMEMLLRDAKIASIYEGTNGIQALDLLGRKLGGKGGAMLMTMLNEINGFLKKNKNDETLKKELARLATARDGLVKTAMGFAGRARKGDILYGAMQAVPFLQMFGDTLVAWLLLDQARLADEMYKARLEYLSVAPDADNLREVLADDAEAGFLYNKIQTAKFFAHQILPRVSARQASIESNDASAFDAVL